MRKPLFSIITICFNEEKRILRTLKNVQAQTYKNYEHIIEDGGSGDSTLSIIEREKKNYLDGQLKVYSEKDNGLYDAMNRAVARTNGEYICFINSGDYLYDNCTLQKVAEAIEKHPGMDWYYGDCIVIFPNGDEYLQVLTSFENMGGYDMTDYFKTHPLSLIHQSIFAHRSCFDNNLFDANLKLRAEVKWYYQCLLKNKKVKGLDFPTCKYSYGGLSERVESLPVHVREMQSIYEEFGLATSENISVLPKENDYSVCFKNLYNMWLAMHQAGYSIEKYLTAQGVSSIAIYGYGELGAHLVNELKDSSVKIDCLIDKQRRQPYWGIQVVRPEEFDAEVDLIIVTAIAHYREIKRSMEMLTGCRIVSLEQVLEDVWEV